MGRAGGLARLAQAQAERLGLAPTTSPALGDVGVIALSDGRQALAIFAAGGICYLRRAEGGAAPLNPRNSIIAAWTVSTAG
jgi:hypothetical protein